MASEMVLIPKSRYEKLSGHHYMDKDGAVGGKEQQAEGEDNSKEQEPSITQDTTSHTMDTARDPPTSPSETTQDPKAYVVQHVPVKLMKKAERLANYIQQHESDMGWNSEGQLVQKGHVVQGTHLVDLIKDAVQFSKGKKEPVGMHLFYKNLAAMNLPESMIYNPPRRELLRQYKVGLVTTEGVKPVQGPSVPPGKLENVNKSRDEDTIPPDIKTVKKLKVKRPLESLTTSDSKKVNMKGIHNNWITF